MHNYYTNSLSHCKSCVTSSEHPIQTLMPLQHMSTGNVGQVCWARLPANCWTRLLAEIYGQGCPEVAVWPCDLSRWKVVVTMCVQVFFFLLYACVCFCVCALEIHLQCSSSGLTWFWPANFVSMSNNQDRCSHLNRVCIKPHYSKLNHFSCNKRYKHCLEFNHIRRSVLVMKNILNKYE